MTHAILRRCLGISLLACPMGSARDDAQSAAEIRLPYAEFQALLERAHDKPPAPEPAPAVLSSLEIRPEIQQGRLRLGVSVQARSWRQGPERLAILDASLSVLQSEPEDAVLGCGETMLEWFLPAPGSHRLRLHLAASQGGPDGGVSLRIPACPGARVDASELPAGHSLAIVLDGVSHVLAAGELLPLPAGGGTASLRLLAAEDAERAQRPPEPSDWSWQSQVLVMPHEHSLECLALLQASALGGSAVEAELPMPKDARDWEIQGEDLLGHEARMEDPARPRLLLRWATRDRMERRLTLRYHLPRRPLDKTWQLAAPGAPDSASRFLLPVLANLEYPQLQTGPAQDPSLLAPEFQAKLAGRAYRSLDGAAQAAVEIRQVPLAAIAEGRIREAKWHLRIEPDGAMLATGQLQIEHSGSLTLDLDTPPGMRLLSWETNGKASPPADLGKGLLRGTLPAGARQSEVTLSFTGRGEALDPVEGTLELALPQTPLFIDSLLWRIDLPAGQLAETHGNLTRLAPQGGQPDSTMHFQKNLCREERPALRVFYRRAGLEP